MEAILAIAIGVVASTGVWLLLRGRTFQVVVGLALLSYAVNLFIFATGRLSVDKEPVLLGPLGATLQHYDDPLPQALVLTAIVIGFATTALFLVALVLGLLVPAIGFWGLLLQFATSPVVRLWGRLRG